MLGVAIAGARIADLIGGLVVEMAGRTSAWTVGVALHTYPTSSEVVREAADQAGKKPRRSPASGLGWAAGGTHLTQ